MSKTTIKIVNALAGSGKTYSAIRYAEKYAALGQRIAIVQPTKRLIQESIDVCQDSNYQFDVLRITKDDTPHVKGKVKEHLATPNDDRGEILFITQQTYFNIMEDMWPNADDWEIIFDELPSVEKYFTKSLKQNHGVITDYLTTGKAISDDRSELIVADNYDAIVKDIAINTDKDDVNVIFQELAHWLNSKHWEVLVDEKAYTELLNKKGDGKLYASAVMMPTVFDGFKSVTIMGAMLEHSILFQLWSNLDVDFQPHTEIINQLQYHTHTNGNLITFKYMYPKNFTKYIANEKGMMDYFKTKIKEDLNKTDSLAWFTNKRYEENYFENYPNAKQLPHISHGLNIYRYYNNVAYMSTMNPNTFHFKTLLSFGLTEDDIKMDKAFAMSYQSLMRISIRNPKDTNRKKVYVFDKQVADALSVYFQGSNVEQLPVRALPASVKPGVKKAKLTDEERKVKETQQARTRMQNMRAKKKENEHK